MNPTPKPRRRFVEPLPKRISLNVRLNERTVRSLEAWEAKWGVPPSRSIDALFFFALSHSEFRLPLEWADPSKIRPLSTLVEPEPSKEGQGPQNQSVST